VIGPLKRFLKGNVTSEIPREGRSQKWGTTASGNPGQGEYSSTGTYFRISVESSIDVAFVMIFRMGHSELKSLESALLTNEALTTPGAGE